jgi:hypothetical protein
MSRPYPVDHQARLRLLEAQRAESQALREVGRVARRLDSVIGRLDAADLELARAEYELVSVSGLPRAAKLLEMEPRELRRRVKLAAKAVDASKADNAGPAKGLGTSPSAHSTRT